MTNTQHKPIIANGKPLAGAVAPDSANCYGHKYLMATPCREAAPELLEALDEVNKLCWLNVDQSKLTIHERNTIETVRAAIAKAKGAA